jgi:ABC-type branched-subunit amino acid transport system ATPase component
MLLEARGLSSGYGKLIVVREVDVGVDQGEIAVLIGPNGSGKSTLVKTIFGLICPVGGEVVFAGESITGMRPDRIVRKGLSYVPQLDNAFPSLTVTENLHMGAYTMDRFHDRIEDLLEIFPLLREKMDVKAINLSGGERQTLALARAMMTEPKLMLLDEPTAGLSPALVTDTLERIKQIRERGTSILLVEQNAKKSLAICDRGYVMVMGRKAFEGTGKEILEHKDIGRLYLGKEVKSDE